MHHLAKIARLAAAEYECCPFWPSHSPGIAFEVTAPPAGAEILAAAFGTPYLTATDEPKKGAGILGSAPLRVQPVALARSWVSWLRPAAPPSRRTSPPASDSPCPLTRFRGANGHEPGV